VSEPRIAELRGREVLDSRGRPTVEAELRLSSGARILASVPSGASTGAHEALELRDGDPARYGGKGVRRAVASIDEVIAPALIGAPPVLADVDRLLLELDGTADKSRLGANALLAVSVATARAGAQAARVPLWRHLAGDRTPAMPLPMVNIVSGGLHAGRQLDFQDFLAIPVGAASYEQALRWVVAIHEATGALLAERGLTTLRADEGGYGPPLPTHADALALLDEAVVRAGLRVGEDVAYALDVAASHFHDAATGRYELRSEGRSCDAGELGRMLEALVDAHAIVSIEDALAEDDWDGWSALTRRLGDRIQLVGDDFFVTDVARLERGIASGAANAVLVKMNQIGTLTETFEVVDAARAGGYRAVISARSGETEDDALADLAVATGAGQIKVGSVTQSERLSKYNRLLRIAEEIGSDAAFGPRPTFERRG
jgi:enolase